MFHITRKFCRNILPEFTAQSGIDKLYPTTDSEYRLVSFHGFVKDKHFHFVTLRAALPNRTHYEPNYRNKQTILQNRKHQKGEKEMGRSLTNNHILNADRLTKAQFKKSIHRHDEVQGLHKCDRGRSGGVILACVHERQKMDHGHGRGHQRRRTCKIVRRTGAFGGTG